MITQEKIDQAPAYFDDIILKPLRDSGINAWVAGGSVKDYLIDTKPVDYDVFFSNKNDFQNAVNHFNSIGADKIWESDNGIKFKLGDNVVDLVKKFYKNASDLINNFDFTVSMFATDGKNLYAGKTSFKDLDGRNIVIHKITNPDSTVKRILKYFKKGFKIKSEEVSKLTNIIQNGGDFRNASATQQTSGDSVPDDTVIDHTAPPPPPPPPPDGGGGSVAKDNSDVMDWIPWILAGMTTLLSIVSED